MAEFDQEWDYGVPQGFGEEEEIFVEEEEQLQQPPKKKAKKREPYLAKCNICERPFKLMASLARHYGVHRMEGTWGKIYGACKCCQHPQVQRYSTKFSL